MTPFIATATPFGRELAVRLFDAKQKEDFRELADEMMAAYGPGVDGRLPDRAPADQFLFHIAVGHREDGPLRVRVAAFDAAATVAISARAFHEALYALARAQDLAPCRERACRVENIRRLLIARGEQVGLAVPRSRRRVRAPTGRKARTRP